MCCRKRRKKINIISHFCLLPTAHRMFIDSLSIAEYTYHFFFLFLLDDATTSNETMLIVIVQLCRFCSLKNMFNSRRSEMWNGEPGKMAFVCNQLSKLSFCKIMNGYASLLGAASHKTVRAVCVRKNSLSAVHETISLRAYSRIPQWQYLQLKMPTKCQKTGAIQTLRKRIDFCEIRYSFLFLFSLVFVFGEQTSRILIMLSVDAF